MQEDSENVKKLYLTVNLIETISLNFKLAFPLKGIENLILLLK